MGVGPDAGFILQAEENRSVGGVELADTVGEDGEYALKVAELVGLSGGKAGGEAMGGEVVGV